MSFVLWFLLLFVPVATTYAQSEPAARADVIRRHDAQLRNDATSKAFGSCVPTLPPAGNTPSEPAYVLFASWDDRTSSSDRFQLAVWHLACDGTVVVRVTPLQGTPFICSSSFVAIQGGRQYDSPKLVTARGSSSFCGDLHVATSFYLDQWSFGPTFDTAAAFTLIFEGVWTNFSLAVGGYVPPPPPPTLVSAVEFYNTNLRHYFVTASSAEASLIDAGGAGPGWGRTGYSFRVHNTPEPNTVGVCRFYGTPGIGPNSHFYTINPAECAAVKTDAGWTYEGIAFYAFPANLTQCPTGTIPLYRAYNGRWQQNDSNHRFTTDMLVYAQMVTQGWRGEGLVMCVLPPT